MTGVTDSNNRTIQYKYDALGNRTQMTTPENRTITYAYDANRRLTGITANSVTFGMTYDDAGRRSTLTYPNNTYATYTYDYSSNLTRVWHRTQGGTTLADINYTYDAVNNRLSRTDTTTSGSDPAGTETMSYDNANELLNLNSIDYSYDYNGNRTQKVDGNTTTTYTYDDENRLVGVQVAVSGTTTQVITYTYDPFGRRIQKNVNGTITNYVYDKDAIILAYNQSGNITTRYTHGLRIDEPLAMDNTSQVYYYHADALGSILTLTNASGAVSQTYVYDSFGNITSGLPPAVTQLYTYTAREYDPETGLYLYRARYYDSKAGRFLQRDPIGFKGGINQYVYVKNNVVNFKDPFGLCPPADCFKVFWDCMAEQILGSWFNVSDWGNASQYYLTAAAWDYAASAGLTYPLRSSIMRGLLSRAGQAVPFMFWAQFLYAEAVCLKREIECANGQ